MSAASTKGGKASADPARAILEAAFAEIAAAGWDGMRMTDVAARVGLPLTEIYRHHPTRFDLLRGLMAHVDAEVLADPVEMIEETPRERLFDLMMRRFDALEPFAEGARTALRAVLRDPVLAIGLAPRIALSMGWMLQAAGLDTHGPRGRLRIAGLMAVHAQALRAWLGDDTPDLSRTMAALDKGLARAENWASTLNRRMPRADRPEDDEKAASAAAESTQT